MSRWALAIYSRSDVSGSNNSVNVSGFLEEGEAYTGVLLWIGVACEIEGGTLLPMRSTVEFNQ